MVVGERVVALVTMGAAGEVVVAGAPGWVDVSTCWEVMIGEPPVAVDEGYKVSIVVVMYVVVYDVAVNHVE